MASWWDALWQHAATAGLSEPYKGSAEAQPVGDVVPLTGQRPSVDTLPPAGELKSFNPYFGPNYDWRWHQILNSPAPANDAANAAPQPAQASYAGPQGAMTALGVSAPDDKGGASYLDGLANVLLDPNADMSANGAAGMLLRQLTGQPQSNGQPFDMNTVTRSLGVPLDKVPESVGGVSGYSGQVLPQIRPADMGADPNMNTTITAPGFAVGPVYGGGDFTASRARDI